MPNKGGAMNLSELPKEFRKRVSRSIGDFIKDKTREVFCLDDLPKKFKEYVGENFPNAFTEYNFVGYSKVRSSLNFDFTGSVGKINSFEYSNDGKKYMVITNETRFFKPLSVV